MKKILTVAVFVFAFALAITPAFAKNRDNHDKNSGTSNFAITSSEVGSLANTGGNTIAGNKAVTTSSNDSKDHKRGDDPQTTCNTCGTNYIQTGGATAGALGANAINTNVGGGSTSNVAFTTSSVGATADSGDNGIYKNVGGTNGIVTGSASASATGINLVNTNVSFGH